MLQGMDPLLTKIEALSEPGCYSVTFTLTSGENRAVVMRMRGDEPVVPVAGSIPGWLPESAASTATIEVVRALHQARQLAGTTTSRLLDLDGGWDVGIGNVVLSAEGLPACVAHGSLEQAEPGVFRCPVCGAAARYDRQP
jgi:hypothetical protein